MDHAEKMRRLEIAVELLLRNVQSDAPDCLLASTFAMVECRIGWVCDDDAIAKARWDQETFYGTGAGDVACRGRG